MLMNRKRASELGHETVAIIEAGQASPLPRGPKRPGQAGTQRVPPVRQPLQDPADELADKLLERIRQEKQKQGSGKGRPNQPKRRRKSSKSEPQRTLFGS